MVNNKKKLLIIGPLPPPYAGPEIGTRHILQSEFLNSTYDIYHINTSLRSSNAERGKLDFTMILAYIKYIMRLIWALVFFRPDYTLYCIMSATTKGWVRDATTILLCRAGGVRIFTQFRGGHFGYFINSLSGTRYKIIKWILNNCTMVLAQADVLKKQFYGLLPNEKIGKLYNSVPEEFYSAFKTVSRNNNNPVNILFVGHLSFAKGYCDVLRVISDIIPQHPVILTCIGGQLEIERNVFCNQATGEPIIIKSPSECYKKYIVENDYTDKVIFLGDRVTGDDKIKAFADADIFVLPSYSEGFSMAILEAMAARLPVIATCVGAAPEIIDDSKNGYIINPGDVDALKSRIIDLLVNNEKRYSLGDNARKTCGRLFVGESGPVELSRLLENSDI